MSAARPGTALPARPIITNPRRRETIPNRRLADTLRLRPPCSSPRLSSAVIDVAWTSDLPFVDLAHTFAVDEIVVLTVCHDPSARLRSYELLAEAFGLVPTS